MPQRVQQRPIVLHRQLSIGSRDSYPKCAPISVNVWDLQRPQTLRAPLYYRAVKAEKLKDARRGKFLQQKRHPVLLYETFSPSARMMESEAYGMLQGLTSNRNCDLQVKNRLPITRPDTKRRLILRLRQRHSFSVAVVRLGLGFGQTAREHVESASREKYNDCEDGKNISILQPIQGAVWRCEQP